MKKTIPYLLIAFIWISWFLKNDILNAVVAFVVTMYILGGFTNAKDKRSKTKGK